MINVIFKLEENDSLLKFKFSNCGILIWPIIRNQVCNYIMKNPQIYMTNSGLSKVKYYFDVLRYSIKNKNSLRQYDLLYLTTQSLNKMGENGCYRNRIYDYYAEKYSNKSIIFEEAFNGEVRLPRSFQNIFLMDAIKLKVKIKETAANIFKNIKSNKVSEIEEFIEFIADNLGQYLSSDQLTTIKNTLYRYNKILIFYSKEYKKLLDIIQPKIIFINALSYGGVNSCISYWAKSLKGCTVCEIQHGYIGENHPSYNYGQSIMNNEEYQKYLPDKLLLFGKYWEEIIKTPSQKLIIGSPEFEKLSQNSSITQKKSKHKTILFISQWTISQELAKLAIELSSQITEDKYHIIYKLHPAEVMNRQWISNLVNLKNIDVVKDKDLYLLLLNADFVIGCYSTALYEALGLNKQVFILNNQYSRKHMDKKTGIWINNAKELIFYINKNMEERSFNKNYYWAENWAQNFDEFIRKIMNE
jgi:hypothetical protein